MSMIQCARCEGIFDSDEDPDCFVEAGNMRRLHKEIVMCEPCRERSEEDGDYDPEVSRDA